MNKKTKLIGDKIMELNKKQIHVLITAELKDEIDKIYYNGEFKSFSIFIESVLKLGIKEYRR